MTTKVAVRESGGEPPPLDWEGVSGLAGREQSQRGLMGDNTPGTCKLWKERLSLNVPYLLS